jgi:hypothetical protein
MEIGEEILRGMIWQYGNKIQLDNLICANLLYVGKITKKKANKFILTRTKTRNYTLTRRFVSR